MREEIWFKKLPFPNTKVTETYPVQSSLETLARLQLRERIRFPFQSRRGSTEVPSERNVSKVCHEERLTSYCETIRSQIPGDEKTVNIAA